MLLPVRRLRPRRRRCLGRVYVGPLRLFPRPQSSYLGF